MAAPFMVLKSRMPVHGLGFKPWRKEQAAITSTPGKDWAKIDCSRKQASDHSDHDQAAQDDYELVLLARKFWPQRVNRELLCVCAPAAGIWKVKVRRFPEIPDAFSADQMFSFQGKLFWADLYQGRVCSDGDDLHTTGDDSAVNFDFIGLPYGYLLEDQTESAKKTRAVSCIGGSIQFVCLDRHRSSHHGRNEPVVEVWTLDLDRCQWRKDQEGFPCPWREFRRQVRFMDDAEARGVEPQYPVLLPGGALCLVLANMHLRRRRIKGFVEEADYIYCFDMHSKRPLWFGLVRDYGTIEPVILPCDFFDPPPARRKRKLSSESPSDPK